LSKTMLDPLEQLQQICPDNKLTIAFDRGGSYPKTFAELNKRGFDWVTYRRAPLVASVAVPRACQLQRSGQIETVMVSDETVTLENLGAVSQLSLYDNNGTYSVNPGPPGPQVSSSRRVRSRMGPAGRSARVQRCGELAAEAAHEGVEVDVFDWQRVGVVAVELAAAFGSSDPGPVGGLVAGA